MSFTRKSGAPSAATPPTGLTTEQRPVVPEANSRRIGQRGACFRRRRRIRDVKGALVDRVEGIGGTRRGEVPGDVRTLLVELVGLHDVVLDQRRVDAPDDEGRDEPENDGTAEDPERSTKCVREACERGDADDDRQDRERGKARGDARVASTDEDALLPEEELELVKEITARDQGKEQSTQY